MMPFRGLFITGGVTKRLADRIKDASGDFLAAYHDKGRVNALLAQVPIYLVKSDDMGQRGAHLRAVRLLIEDRSGQQMRLAKGKEDAALLVPSSKDPHNLAQVA